MKKTLKTQNKGFNIDIIDILSHFDPTGTNKFLPLLVRELKKSTLENILTSDPSRMEDMRYTIESVNKISTYTEDEILKFPTETISALKGYNEWLAINNNININIKDLLTRFEELVNKNLIAEKDVQKYQTLKDINDAVSEGEFQDAIKNESYKKQILYEDKNWFLIRPLTQSSSVKYGYGTRWCTSMRNDPEYFYRYSRDYTLFYLFNKTNKRKYGIQIIVNETKESGLYVNSINIYDESDNSVDSFKAKIPQQIMKIIFDAKITYKSNYGYMLIHENECAKAVEDFFNGHGQPKVATPQILGEYIPDEPVMTEENNELPQENINNDDFLVNGNLVVSYDMTEYEATKHYVNNAINELIKNLNTKSFTNIFNNLMRRKRVIIMRLPLNELNKIRTQLSEALKDTSYTAICFPSHDGQVHYQILK